MKMGARVLGVQPSQQVLDPTPGCVPAARGTQGFAELRWRGDVAVDLTDLRSDGSIQSSDRARLKQVDDRGLPGTDRQLCQRIGRDPRKLSLQQAVCLDREFQPVQWVGRGQDRAHRVIRAEFDRTDRLPMGGKQFDFRDRNALGSLRQARPQRQQDRVRHIVARFDSLRRRVDRQHGPVQQVGPARAQCDAGLRQQGQQGLHIVGDAVLEVGAHATEQVLRATQKVGQVLPAFRADAVVASADDCQLLAFAESAPRRHLHHKAKAVCKRFVQGL